MNDQSPKTPHSERTWPVLLSKIVGVIFWGCLIALCFVYRDKITIESIVNFTPENIFLAICIILLLFALKSISVVIYGGILYAASGVLFSLPTAIFVNLLGTVIMTSIPFFIGKKAGTKTLERLIQKNSKLELLQSIPKHNEWFVSFFVRMIGLLPGDLVGIYLGASDLRYSYYISGTMAGLLPSVLSFSVMGMSIHDISSPAFILSAGCEIGLMVLSVLLYFIWRRKRNARSIHHEIYTKE